MKTISILGATGTIGINTLDVIRRHSDQYRVFALTAHTQVERLVTQCAEFRPKYAVMVDATAAEKLQTLLRDTSPETKVLCGEEGLQQVASDPAVNYVMAAIVGAAGLKSTLAAVRAGKRVLLANKEALVMSGELFMNEVRQSGAELLPIDSEHNAIFQCLPANYANNSKSHGVKQILLTASGGPLRSLPIDQFTYVTPEQAITHPNWNMGKKISVDSATMMNKGLEVIEACWLFNVSVDDIEVVIHPQSIIHSMVEYIDGSVLAQLGQPDMRTPIAHALAWPERMDSGVKRLNLFDVAKLEFSRPDLQRYPCLVLAQQAARQGGTATTILNAANEVAVQAFLDKEILFPAIADTVEHALGSMTSRHTILLNEILDADQQARWYARQYILQHQKLAGGLGK